ncbi:GNAT family N-acetyltransferase [Methyloceanibacter sp.]|uniref:GNAT family N-acetyltransferase n=1 Tax=Methyloceanibacter sp. TaxID=1965321 RepID=UPI003D6C8D85
MALTALYRPATKADASALAVLVDIAGEGLPAHLWSTLKAPGQSILEVGREGAAREEGGFSYRNAIVAAVEGEIAACLVGYRLDDPYDLGTLAEIPELVRPLVLLEAKVPGSWYVNVFATFPEFRRQGIGRELLAIAEQKARESGAPALSVIVAGANERAARVYRHAGFAAAAWEKMVPFPGYTQAGDWVC